MEPVITIKGKSVLALKHAMDEKLKKNKTVKFIVEVNTINFDDLIQLKQYPIIDFSIGLTIVEKASIGLNFSSIKRTQEYIKKEKSSARKERLLSVIHFIIFLSCLSYLLYKW